MFIKISRSLYLYYLNHQMATGFFNNENIVASPSTTEFADLYIRVRKAEQRVYTDEELKKLPFVSPTHIHYSEWKIRKKSSERLIKYLQQKNKPLRILEIGCGNGWLSAALASASADPLWIVTGTDINLTELEQAKRVFNSLPNLNFMYADIHSAALNESYDLILFAASIQYFRGLQNTIDQSIKLLSPGGEIHIMDTIFYKEHELAAAGKRTIEYYSSLGFPEAALYYCHHSIKELQQYNFTIIDKPSSLIGRLLGNNSPFYHICIKQKK